jgi:flagellar hook assembly protein FlgD
MMARVGPSGTPGDDLLGMAPLRAREDPRPHMTERHQTSSPARPARALRRDVIRTLAIILAIVALLLTSSALNLVDHVAAAVPKKVVVVAGPVHSQTEEFLAYASDIAAAAEAQGMEVIRIFHPNAPAVRVKNLAQGADLFVYVGHGNGWPSPIGEFQEETKNGLGLDAADPDLRDPNTVVYKGADWLRENILLAPDAVVILSHLSYASGNASSGTEIPTRDVAVQRVDNFANGFLSIGARVVWALGWQPGADIIDALQREDSTMDAVFMSRYRDGVNPRNGWIGYAPAYYDSVRIPGARIHIDEDPTEGYLRAVTGDLDFTTTAWRGAVAPPPDTTAPVVSSVRARQSAVTIASVGSTAPVFTPNGDGLSDVMGISYSLSENAFLEVKVKRGGGTVRRYSTWAQAGPGIVNWNGRNDKGRLAAEGKYNIYLTPTDRAGNRGVTRLVSVKVLNSLKAPAVSPALFWARDGDALAPVSTVRARLIRPAMVTIAIRDARGKVVRHGMVDQKRPAGKVDFVWGGRNDAGKWVPDGRYTARLKVTTADGWYAHDVIVRHMAFQAYTPKWTRQRGDTITLRLTSSEPLKGKPVVTANQRGMAKYQIPPRKVSRLAPTQYRVVIDTRQQSKPGVMRVRVVGTDKRGGNHAKVFAIGLR